MSSDGHDFAQMVVEFYAADGAPDTSAAEALIAAAVAEIEVLRRTAELSPSDAGMLGFARDSLRTAIDALVMRRRLRTGP